MNTRVRHWASATALRALSPWPLLVIYVAGCLALWATAPAWANFRLSVDNLEQLAWVQHIDWGYPKHPPFPTWVLWVAERVFPHSLELTYALGAAQVGAMLLLAGLLMRETLGERRALVGVLLITGITYYTNRLYFYNHNTALMVAHAAATLLLWRCVRSRSLLAWALLGAVWGCGMLSKYQMVLTIACNLGFLAYLARRDGLKPTWQAHGAGVALASLVAATLLAPHVAWLVVNDFPTFHYAGSSVAAQLPLLERPADISGFLGNQLGRTLPVFAIAGLLSLVDRQRAGRNHGGDPAEAAVPPTTRVFLGLHALGPFAVMVALSLFGGVDLQMHWGTAFLWMAVPLGLASARGAWLGRVPLLSVFSISLLAQVLTFAWHALHA